MNIGKRLKKYRELLGLTQGDLANASGIDDKYYGRIERNESNPTINVLEKICLGLGIQLEEFILIDDKIEDTQFIINPRIGKLLIDSLKKNFDIHINREAIINNCESCIWYNGYIGSLNFDEFEMKLYVKGNVKARLYQNYEEVLYLNSVDISIELERYVKNDQQLALLIEYMPYDEEVLREKEGNALFVEENNWLTAVLVDNQKDIILEEDIVLDSIITNQSFYSVHKTLI